MAEVLKPEQDAEILKELRDFRTYAEERWRRHRDESNKDRRYLAGDPWEKSDKDFRRENGIPCINHDELGQYVNQAVNNVRANKRGIKIEPKGLGASEQTAEIRQGQIRGIEYSSRAQQAYLTAFQQLVEGSYGFFRITRRYVSQDEEAGDEQEIVLKPILNPDSVLYDPDCKEADWSDARKVLVLDPWPREVFRETFPDAQLTDFASSDTRIREHWIHDNVIVVGEYYRVKVERVWNKAKTRKIEKKTIYKYLTNGVEILEGPLPMPSDEGIPIIPMIGPMRYVDYGGGPELQISSLPRLARDPQMSLAYLTSQQLWEAGLAPRIPAIGYEGQFATSTDWEHLSKVATAYAEVKATTDGTGSTLLPLPHFTQFTPNTVAYEAAKDSCRRAIQAAMGISPLPTAAQRQNEKSGVALQRIQDQQQIGSYHFNQIYENALEYAGRIIDSWIPKIYDTPRDIALHKPNDTREVIRINEPYQDGEETKHYPVENVDHDVTITTGPSNESQREEAGDFLEMMVKNLQTLPIAPPQQAKLLALAIKMKQLGPLGDEMAEIISPDEQQPLPPQAQQAIQQAGQQVQVLQKATEQMHLEIQQLQQEKQAKVIDNAAKKEIEQMRIEADLAKAEILTKAQSVEERLTFVEDLIRQFQIQKHEAAMANMQHSQAQDMAAQQAAAEQRQPDESVSQ